MSELAKALAQYNTAEQLADALMATEARVARLVSENERLREQVEMLGYLWTRDASYDDAAAFGELFAPIRSRTPVYSDQRRIAAVRSALAGTEARNG